MNFLFFDAANHVLFSRSDAEQAEHCHEEMSLHCLFPYDPEKAIQRGMRIGYTDSLGVFQCFEIRKCRDYEPDHYQEITAEHIVISELTDEHFPGKDWTDVTAASALADILNGTLWNVGIVTASNISSGNSSMGNVWQDVRTIENNWNVYITPRVVVNASGIVGRYLDIVPAGGTWRGLRLSLEKNMDDASVTWDDTRCKTALYGYGKSVAVSGQDQNQPLTFADVVWAETADHPAKPAGQKYLEDPAATAAYGRNGRPRFGFYQNGDIADPEILLQKTWETLKTVSIPDVSIDGVVCDLYRLGFTDVPIRLHDTAIVEIRPTGVNLQKEIIKYTEDLLNPQSSRLNIGAYIPNIIYINRENAKRSGAGGGSGGQSNIDYKLEEYYTQIEGNSQQLKLKAAQRDLDATNQDVDLLKGELIIEAGKVSQIVTAIGDNGQVTAASVVTAINSGSSSIKLNADHIEITGNTGIAGALAVQGFLTAENVQTNGITVHSLVIDNGGANLGNSNVYYNGYSMGLVVNGFGTPTASGGQISIPYTTMSGGGSSINFNIADTQFYQNGVSAADHRGWADSYAAFELDPNTPQTLNPGGNVTIKMRGKSSRGAALADVDDVTISARPLNLQSKSVTSNGTVTPDSGYDGLSSVDVNVPGSSVTPSDISIGSYHSQLNDPGSGFTNASNMRDEILSAIANHYWFTFRASINGVSGSKGYKMQF